jgi:hypothetical protein
MLHSDEHIAEMETDEAMTRRALDLLGSKRNDAYEAALAALREDPQPNIREIRKAGVTRSTRRRLAASPLDKIGVPHDSSGFGASGLCGGVVVVGRQRADG